MKTAVEWEDELRQRASVPTDAFAFSATECAELAEKVGQLRHAVRVLVGIVTNVRKTLFENYVGPVWDDQRRAVEGLTRPPVVPTDL